jgi:hypothetical protein
MTTSSKYDNFFNGMIFGNEHGRRGHRISLAHGDVDLPQAVNDHMQQIGLSIPFCFVHQHSSDRRQ